MLREAENGEGKWGDNIKWHTLPRLCNLYFVMHCMYHGPSLLLETRSFKSLEFMIGYHEGPNARVIFVRNMQQLLVKQRVESVNPCNFVP